jgi:hypothetical protein
MNWIFDKLSELQNRFFYKKNNETNEEAEIPKEKPVNYTDFRTDELKDMARKRGLKRYSKLNKAQLCELLSKN